LVKKDNSVLEADKDPITVSEALFCNLFKSSETYVNGQLIHCHGNDSNYRGFLMTLLDTKADEKKNSLSTQMWYSYDSKTLSSINSGWKSRFDITKKSESFVVIGRPLDPFFVQKKLLMPKTEIKKRLHRSSPNVYLAEKKPAGDTSTDPYKLVIQEIKLSLRRVLPHPSIISQHNSALARNEKVIYPMELVDVRRKEILAMLSILVGCPGN
jgi:hypothetical protein